MSYTNKEQNLLYPLAATEDDGKKLAAELINATKLALQKKQPVSAPVAEEPVSPVVTPERSPGDALINATKDHIASTYPEQEATAPVTERSVPAYAGSDFDYLSQFTDEYTPKPLSDEEIKRRTRVASTIEGISALGNAASALSNVIYTSKGAVPQTLPQGLNSSASIRELEEQERLKRNEIYQRAKERIAQQNARAELGLKKQQADTDREVKLADLERKAIESNARMQKLLADMNLAAKRGQTEEYRAAKAAFDAESARQASLFAAAKEQSEITRNHASAAASYGRANASNADAEQTKGGNTITLYYNEGANSFPIKKEAWENPATLAGIARELGIEVKPDNSVSATSESGFTFNFGGKEETLSKAELQVLIGDAMANAKNMGTVQKIAKKYGQGEGKETPKTNNKKANPMGGKKSNPMK